MADDVTAEDGRYRGFDVTDDDTSNEEADCVDDGNAASENHCSCLHNSRIESLEKKIREQSATIAKLRNELLQCNNGNDTTGKKKRKRDDAIEDVINAEMIADAADKDILIKELTDENENLKKQQKIRKPQVENKAIEARRLLPDPNSSAIVNEINDSFSAKINEIKEVIGSLIDEKLERRLGNASNNSYSGNSYAATVMGATRATTNEVSGDDVGDAKVPDLRSIMLNQKNEELLEQSDRRNRAQNLIMHGKKDESPDGDERFVNAFLTQVGCEKASLKSMKRIGSNQPDKVRPILVQLKNEEEKTRIMNNLRKLKDIQIFTGISITDDYTLAEREMIKTYRMKAKELNNENINSDTIIRVRGSPKNGLFLKKIKKTVSPQEIQANEEMTN